MSCRRQLVLEMIRRHFRAVGASPSHREISEGSGVGRRHVGAWLDHLQAEGLLTYQPRRPRSIVLCDRMANLSDTELHLACAGRGWTVVEAPARAAPLSHAFPVDPRVPDYGLPLLDALRHIE
jgi:DNA-binding GntR family transcriptional regulator